MIPSFTGISIFLLLILQSSPNDGGQTVKPCNRLAITLRLLDGGLYLDQTIYFKVGRSKVFAILNKPFDECIAAVYDISIEIQEPLNEYVPRNFFRRRGMYVLPIQACFDAQYRFLTMFSLFVGYRHDSVVFSFSRPSRKLRSGQLLLVLCISGDAAYSRADGVVIPW